MGCWLASVFGIGPVKCILQLAEDRAVVFCGDEEVAVQLGHLVASVMPPRSSQVHEGVIRLQEAQRIVTQIDYLKIKIGPVGGDAVNPAGRFLLKAVLPQRADNDADLGLKSTKAGHVGR